MILQVEDESAAVKAYELAKQRDNVSRFRDWSYGGK